MIAMKRNGNLQFLRAKTRQFRLFISMMVSMKILVIRFSSIGDLTQALSIPSLIKHYHPKAELHFVTRLDLHTLLENHPHINHIWTLDRQRGLKGLLSLIRLLKKENFTHIYDAHNNVRSLLITLGLSARLSQIPKVLRRPMMRIKRFFLIRFQINFFEKPFSGQRDLLKPLEKWHMPYFLPSTPQLFLKPELLSQSLQFLTQLNNQNYIAIAPSAAYALKRWPLTHWHQLIQNNPQHQFVVLAGPSDHFTAELNVYKNILNLTGKTNLHESAALIAQAQFVISNDTGLLHFAEQLGRPAIALMGPAPFGFPSRPSTTILEKNLSCRPCSKHGQGPCKNTQFQACMNLITAQEVQTVLNQRLSTHPTSVATTSI